jgi:hypothetical protein
VLKDTILSNCNEVKYSSSIFMPASITPYEQAVTQPWTKKKKTFLYMQNGYDSFHITSYTSLLTGDTLLKE